MNEQPIVSPTVNYWLVEVRDDVRQSETLMIPLADYADVLETDDIAFLRNRDESGRVTIVGWAECRPTTDGDGRRNLSFVPRLWGPDFAIALEETPELWSLSFRREPGLHDSWDQRPGGEDPSRARHGVGPPAGADTRRSFRDP